MSESQSFHHRGTTPKKAFSIVILVLILVASIVYSALYYHHKTIYKNNITSNTTTSPKEKQEITDNKERERGGEQLLANEPDELSATQKEISQEVFDLMEDRMYEIILDIDNSKNFITLEEELTDMVMAKIDKKKLEYLTKKLGQEYVDELKRKGYTIVRMKIDKHYDDDYIDDIVSDVNPKLQAYFREILRRKVLDRIYLRVSDEVLESVADEIIDYLRTEYAKKLKDEAEKWVEDFVNDRMEENTKKQATPQKSQTPPKTQLNRQN